VQISTFDHVRPRNGRREETNEVIISSINVISKVINEERVHEFTFRWQWKKPLGGFKKSVHDATCVCLNKYTPHNILTCLRYKF
jgi:hypothetical protein